MQTLRGFFYQLPKTLAECFSGVNLVWQLVAFILTYFIVTSGFDWSYHQFFLHTILYPLSFTAGLVGAIVPIFLPINLLIRGRSGSKTRLAAFATGQAVFLAFVISSFYKVFTGRIPPKLNLNMLDLSHGFQFGFLRGGVFNGWPSSHAAVAFALGAALYVLYPENKKIRWISIIYAIYIGLGASISFHWFSDFLAGAIIGTIIGVTVGKNFKPNSSPTAS